VKNRATAGASLSTSYATRLPPAASAPAKMKTALMSARCDRAVRRRSDCPGVASVLLTTSSSTLGPARRKRRVADATALYFQRAAPVRDVQLRRAGTGLEVSSRARRAIVCAPLGRPLARLLDRRPAGGGDRPDAKLTMSSALRTAGPQMTRGVALSP